MRKAISRASAVNKTRIAETKTVPAPIGGWNARDPIANMPKTDAVYMKNWLPKTGYVQTRKGCQNWVTSIPGTVQGLMTYNPRVGSTKRFATSNSGLFDITGTGVAAASLLAITNGQCQYAQTVTSGGNFLSVVNGTNPLALYDGTTWQFVTGVSVPYAITGLDTDKLINVTLFKRRQFFVEKASMSLWYLPVDAIAGALTEFPLGAYFKKGGYIVSCISWTIDAGDGLDDYLVILSSEGEVAIYRGTDPSSAATWASRGIYYLGKALGYRSLIQVGGDVLALTVKGAYPLSKALQSAVLNNKVAISDKIQDAYTEAARLYGDFFGWNATVFPEESFLMINVPTSPFQSASQFVMNTVTGAWSSFTNWDAVCWMYSEGDIYFGTVGKVVQAFVGYKDYEGQINADCKSAFNYFDSTAVNKQWTLLRPVLQAQGQVASLISLEIEFTDNVLAQGPNVITSGEALWDTGIWDTSLWGGGDQVSKDWVTPSSQVGYCAATRLKIASNSSQTKWIATDYAYLKGGVL